MKDKGPWIIIGALLAIIAYLFAVPPGTTKTVTHTDTVNTTVHDTVMVEVPVHSPYPVEVHDTVHIIADTAKILEMYSQVHEYSDTVSDSCFYAVINDRVYLDRIVSRDFSYSVLCQREVRHETVVYPNGLFIGPMVGGSQKTFGLGASGAYAWKDKMVFVGFDAVGMEVYAGYLFRAGKRR